MTALFRHPTYNWKILNEDSKLLSFGRRRLKYLICTSHKPGLGLKKYECAAQLFFCRHFSRLVTGPDGRLALLDLTRRLFDASFHTY